MGICDAYDEPIISADLFQLIIEAAKCDESEQRQRLKGKIQRNLESNDDDKLALLDVLDRDRLTFLHILVDEEALDLLTILVPHFKGNVDCESDGLTPLYYAITAYEENKDQYFKIIKLLLENGADPFHRSTMGKQAPSELVDPDSELGKLFQQQKKLDSPAEKLSRAFDCA